MSFRHAVEMLRADAGLSEEPPKARDGRKVAKKSTVAKLAAPVEAKADDTKLLGQVVGYYHEALKGSPEALGYLAGRGLRNAELVERFRLGFANRTLGYRLPQKNRQAGAELRGRLQALGVLRTSGHEHFNGSLVVPIVDENGDVVQMYGRKVTTGLRMGTALHLYLPGPHRGVWNVEALKADRDIILCESLIDAMTFWCAGLRNVTCSYGVNGFTEEHLQGFARYGTRRVLIAYDRDQAGEVAANKLATRLSAVGLGVYRVQFPKGMDANEYAQKMTPADKALELVIRQAVWLAGGQPAMSRWPSETVASTVMRVAVAEEASLDETAAPTEEMGVPAAVAPTAEPSPAETATPTEETGMPAAVAPTAEPSSAETAASTEETRVPALAAVAPTAEEPPPAETAATADGTNAPSPTAVVTAAEVMEIMEETAEPAGPSSTVPTGQAQGGQAAIRDDRRPVWYAPGQWPWDRWRARAIASGMSKELASLGAEVMRDAQQHAWPEELVQRCWVDDGQAMIGQAMTDAAAAERRWRYWLDSDGGRGYFDERGQYVWFDEPVLDPDQAQRARERAEFDGAGPLDGRDEADGLDGPNDSGERDEPDESGKEDEPGDDDDDESAAEDVAGAQSPEPKPPPASPSSLVANAAPAGPPGPVTRSAPTPPPAGSGVPPVSSRPAPGGAEPATPAVPMESGEHEVHFRFGDRRVRIRGLHRNKSYDQLKVNILVGRGEAFFVDTVDLYHARQRAAFVGQAADELKLSAEVLKKDLGHVLLSLEALQEQAIAEQLAPQKPAVVLSAQEKAEALELLKDPKLLDRIVGDFARCGVVGEEVNKLVGYIAAVSRKLDEPLAVIVQSSSAAGKSSLLDAVLAFVPEEERVKYSAMTGQSLYYLGETELSHKILAIVEEEGAERASYALKLLQSEGELTIASTGKDPQTGKLQTNEYRVKGPVMILLTTTAIEIDEELLNRCLVLTVDEGAAQTAAIHQRQRQGRTLAGLLGRRDKESALRVHRNAQRLLRRLPVVNPYASQLTFAAHKTRMRRDHMKYLGLIETIALLHQYQREVKTVAHAGESIEYIEVTRRDIAVANRLAHQVLGRTLDELPPQTRRLLGLLDELVSAACVEHGIERSDFHFSRRQVREYTGWGNTQLKVHLARLVEMEYVAVHRVAHAQAHVYELCHDGRGSDGTAFLSGLADPGAIGTDVASQDNNRSDLEGDRSGAGRGSVGPRSAGGRSTESVETSANSATRGRNGASNGANAVSGNVTGHAEPADLLGHGSHEYDDNRSGLEVNRSGLEGDRSGAGRGSVGPRSAGGRSTESAETGANSATRGRNGMSNGVPAHQGKRPTGQSQAREPGAVYPGPARTAGPAGAELGA